MIIKTIDTKKDIDMAKRTYIDDEDIAILGANDLEGRPTMMIWEDKREMEKYIAEMISKREQKDV